MADVSALRPAAPELRRSVLLAAFLAVHVLLALGIRVSPAFGLIHVAVSFGVAVVVAAVRPARELSYVIAYFAGAEVMWRMSRVGVFHEFAKYAIAVVIVIVLMRMHAPRNRTVAIVYFGLLLPSAILTLFAFDLDGARQQISFNLSGPLSLALCVIFFSNVRLSADDLRWTFLTFMGPALAIATFTFLSTRSAGEILFTTQSNMQLSGGFGPNQVSSTLGVGLLFAVLLLFERKLPWRARAPLIALALVFAVQAALTFSRGGVLFALVAAAAAILYFVRQPRTRIMLLALGAVLFIVGRLVVAPRLDTFTGGKLAERYASTEATGRTLLAGFDLQIFLEHPLLGVGPGAASELRGEMGRFAAAHTEYTRMLAEHGVLGVAALIAMAVLCVRTFRQAQTLHARAFVAALLVWALLFIAVNGMRIAAPSMMFGLACAVAFSSIPIPPRRPAGT